jgi:hypothetical protein
MKIIGAGLPRTATTTQWLALKTLGVNTYHMKDMMADMERGVALWRRAYNGEEPWDEIFEGFDGTVDWPAAFHWRELMDRYPEAKVLLSVRDGDAWAKSMADTLNQIYFGDSFMRSMCQARYRIDPAWAAWIDLNVDTCWKGPRGAFANTFGERAPLVEAMERWNEEVKATVPAERLIVWTPKDGWEPLCEALDVPVPDEPLPHAFDTETFKDAITGGAIAAVSAYWEARTAASVA